MKLEDLKLLYELVDPDLASPQYYRPKDEARFLIDPLLAKFICADAGRKTLDDAAKDLTILRLKADTFEDFCLAALDLLLTKRRLDNF